MHPTGLLLHEGQEIRGTYEVEKFLGEGAFAEVYRVRHRFLGRQAMKVFKLPGMSVDEAEAMLGEAVMLSRLGHPNIVRVFEANTTQTARGPCAFFTMEYVAGGSLEQFWKSFGARFVPVESVVDVLRQACRGLSVAHGERPPIIHRDIKPQNLLVGYDADGLRVRVSDFGLAKRANPLTLLASARGTRAFKAPEVFRSLESDSCAGDVWAIGCTAYLLLTDRLPFADVGDLALFEPDALQRPIRPPSQLNVTVDEMLDQIVLRALSIDPARRFATAQELLAALDRWRPATAAGPKSADLGLSDVAKIAFGLPPPQNEQQARAKAAQAIAMARSFARLTEAADLMEEAINAWPPLRAEHEYRLRLWRRGLVQ